MRVTKVESTDLFVGEPDEPVQLVRVQYVDADGRSRLEIEGEGLTSEPQLPPAGDGSIEIPVRVERVGVGRTVPGPPAAGQRRRAEVLAAGRRTPFEFVVAEPGWTMYMISHFHYDPVWWNTQGAYTSVWTENPPGRCRQNNAFALVAAHLEMARRESVYKFVLAEVDYLKPYFDTHPEDRADLRRFIDEGRVEVMGGTYNEPNTNLTGAETSIRNFVHGVGFQRDVLGAHPATAWQLDVFGHDPQFPGMAADAGLTSSSWARGPHHQWGPMQDGGDPRRMQFSSEFEWIAPSGLGLLTHYMPAHYAAGWWMDSSTSLAEAERATYKLFASLKTVALTRNVLLPVGTDYTPPNAWVTEIHRDWNARYTWPRFVCALPSEFFAAVRAESTAAEGLTPSPQTRDMNPIYTGKDVSFIDTKQANRAAEDAVLGAERFAVFACLLSGARYPEAALAKAWVQLAYGAHHDAITGSESDQVYLDLLTGWRDAWELGRAARSGALQALSTAVASQSGSIVVWNPLAHKRTDVVTVHLDSPLGPSVRVVDSNGNETAALVEHDGHTVSWLARDVGSLGWRTYRLVPGRQQCGWESCDATTIVNERYRLTVDPSRGGGVASLIDVDDGRELIAPGRVGNELAVYHEYSAHPEAGEGPWHLLPTGPVELSSATEAVVEAYRCPIGERLTVRGRVGDVLRYRQEITLWRGIDRVDCRTTIDEFTGADRLVRLRWPCPIPGALPVSEVGDAVVGRGFGLFCDRDADADRTCTPGACTPGACTPGTCTPGTCTPGACTPGAVDSALHPWTLDNPAVGWFGLSSTARIRVGPQSPPAIRALSVAEVVAPSARTVVEPARDLMVALVRAGVTATCTGADRPRYGNLDVDSNLPDARIALGGPDDNAFTAAVLSAAGDCYTAELHRQLAATGQARVLVPATASLATVWQPGADLRDVLALPVLIIAGYGASGLDNAIAAVTDDLDDGNIEVCQAVPSGCEQFESRTVALLNRGVPGFAVEPDGTLHSSLMRSCTGWPSGVWIDPPRRTAPDGSNFALQHWSHSFDFALVSRCGDWRNGEIPSRSAEFNHPMVCVQPAGTTGVCPADGSLMSVQPAGAVALAALKARGNPTAQGSSISVDPAAVTLRLVETRGAATEVSIRSDLGTFSGVAGADLLEIPRPTENPLRLHGYQIATVLAHLDSPRVSGTPDRPLAPEAEAAQPLYARYWLHNRGPAPLGGLPAVAHLHPEAMAGRPGQRLSLRLTVASDCSDATLHGSVRLELPTGWQADRFDRSIELERRGSIEWDLELAVPADAHPGDYPVRVALQLTGDVPSAWSQPVEDVCVVSVGGVPGPLIRLAEGPNGVVVARGEASSLTATIASEARGDLNLEAHLISPWGTWDWIGPASAGAVLPARSTVDITFDVAPPPWADHGRWWALIRVGCAGRLLYTEAVTVVVT